MKKFLSILCVVAMVAGLSSNAFANPSLGNPINVNNFSSADDTQTDSAAASGETQTGTGDAETPATPAAETPAAPAETPAAPAGGGEGEGVAAETPAAPAAPAETAGGAASGEQGGEAATPAIEGEGTEDQANAEDYEEGTAANDLAGALADETKVYLTSDILSMLEIDGTIMMWDKEEKAWKEGKKIDVTKLTIISKALNKKSKGVKMTENKEDGVFEVDMNGNDLTKDRKSEEMVALFAPADKEKKAQLVAVEAKKENKLSLVLPADGAFCLCLIKE